MKKIIITLLIAILLVCFWNPSTSLAKTAENDWWNLDWDFRKEIRIDHEMAVADLENFPILFHNTSSDFSKNAQYDGDDFVFISSDGTMKYNHEIEYYSRTTGEIIAWVNITSLSSTGDTTLYVYYGNPSCSNQENVVGTWDSNFVGVWHCNNDVDNDEGDIKDSTFYYNHGTTQNMETEDLVQGKISGALNFGGIDEKVLVYDSLVGSLDLTQYLTLECWWKASDLSDPYNTLMGKTSSMGAWQYEFRIRDTYEMDNIYSFLTFGGDHYGNNSLSINTWYYATVTYDPSDITLYNNGEISIIYDSTEIKSTYADFGFGAAGEYGHYFKGIIDEVRVSKLTRSEDWVKTSYNTINNPKAFLSVGIEESRPFYNNPPNTPYINGPLKGKPKIEYEYTFNSTDPDGDPVMYFIDWGDNNTEWTEYSDSGQEIKLKHAWDEEGNYTIKAKAKDINDYESNWSEFEVTIPRTRVSSYLLYQWFLERFPILKRLLILLN